MNTQEKKDFLISQGWSFTEKAHNIDDLHAWVSPDASHKIHNSGIKVVTDQAYSFVSGEYIKKTETERKTQDILIAEMTRKIVALQEELDSYKAREASEKQERTRSVLAIAAINERGAYKKCEDCNGSGYEAHTMYSGSIRCQTCDGTGEVKN